MLKETASQTAGPYLHIGLAPHTVGIDACGSQDWNKLAAAGARGRRIRIEGTIRDGIGALVRDAMIEIWQADAEGRHDHPDDAQAKAVDPAFRGFGRAVADFESGLWWFETVKPGRVPGRRGTRMAPHVNVAIFARGLNIQLNTRLYFADEAAANAEDPVLLLIEPKERRGTLLAHPESRDGTTVYRFEVRLQGESETVFFDV